MSTTKLKNYRALASYKSETLNGSNKYGMLMSVTKVANVIAA